MSRCHEAEVTDTNKPVGQDMEEETTDELLCGQTDKPVGTGLVVVAGTEGNGFSIEGDESLVGDGGPVGVMAQVAEHMLGTIERGLRVGVPFDSSQVADEPFEGGRVLEAGREAKIALTPGLLEAVEELATEQFCQGPDRNEEVVSCMDPPCALPVRSPCRGDDMQVNMEQEVLIPGMKDGGEPGQRLEPRPVLG